MIYSICPNCFNQVDTFVCPHCGYDQNNAKKFEGTLFPETILNARYLVGRVLGKGGFGVTYLAKDLATGKNVAIKECMPENYSYRAPDDCIYEKDSNTLAFHQCKENFQSEIEALHSLKDNSFVVDIENYFSENNTVYFVMEYIDGVSVKILTNSNEGKISLNDATLILFTIGSALIEVHKKGIIHRDISPENIMIDRDGEIKLIDFGASKNYFDNSYYKNESIFLKPGFAPPEQYSLSGNQGPWTDVYALGATFYTAVSGQPLIDSVKRLEGYTMKTLFELDCGVSKEISDVIARSIEPEIHSRFPDVGSFLDALANYVPMNSSIDNKTIGIINQEKENENRYGDNDNHTRGLKIPYAEVVSGYSTGKVAIIPEFGFISIGRSEDNDISINDFDEIGRHHAFVGFDRVHKRFIVVDNDSVNGTFYSNNRKMLSQAQSFLQDGETFFICQNGVKVKLYLK